MSEKSIENITKSDSNFAPTAHLCILIIKEEIS